MSLEGGKFYGKEGNGGQQSGSSIPDNLILTLGARDYSFSSNYCMTIPITSAEAERSLSLFQTEYHNKRGTFVRS